jgi:hypothetical protein
MLDQFVYEAEAIEAWVSDWLSRLSANASAVKKRPLKSFNAGNSDKANFEAVKAGCEWVNECSQNPRLDEPTWFALASIAGYSDGGPEIFHEISAMDPRYDFDETSEKLKHAVEAKPRTCADIHENLGFSGCANCPFRGKIASPIALGYQAPAVVELMKNNVLETQTGRYFDLITETFATKMTFNDKYSHLIEGSQPHTVLSKNGLARKVDVSAYLPGVQTRFATLDNGLEAINTWKPSPLQPQDGDCSVIHRHFDLMFPDLTIRNHILDCLAFLAQKPGQKIAHAFVTIGKQGSGKSLLFKLIQKVFGPKNCRMAESHHLGMRFNAFLADVQVSMFEEIWTAERRETYNGIKTMITSGTMTVEEKNIPVYEARTPDFMLGTSNHTVPIVLEEGERRFCLYESPMEPQGDDYYQSLGRAIDEDAGVFLNELLKRDISAFNPNRRPPMTETKAEIMRSSRSQITQEIEAMMAEGDAVFWHDMVNVNDVRRGLHGRIGKTASQNEIASALKSLGAVTLKPVKGPLGNNLRLWAWRNTERWVDASPDDIRQHLSKPGPSNI